MRGVGHRAQLSLCTTTSVTLLSLTELTTQGSTVLCLTTPVLPGPALRFSLHPVPWYADLRRQSSRVFSAPHQPILAHLKRVHTCQMRV